MGNGLLCGLLVWRRRTNRRPRCPPLSYPSTSLWTAWPDGSGRWDNWMAAQHLPRDLVGPSSGFNNSFKRKKIPFVVNRTFNETPTERLQHQWLSWVNILKMKILHWFICFFFNEEVRTSHYFIKRCRLQKTLGTNAFAEPKPKFVARTFRKQKQKWYP